MKPIKGHLYLLNYSRAESTRFFRGTNIVSEKNHVYYKGT